MSKLNKLARASIRTTQPFIQANGKETVDSRLRERIRENMVYLAWARDWCCEEDYLSLTDEELASYSGEENSYEDQLIAWDEENQVAADAENLTWWKSCM